MVRLDRLSRLMILAGIIMLLSSIILGDILLQVNSSSQELIIPPHGTLVTSFNPNSIVVFQGNGVSIHGNNVYTLGCKVINLQGKVSIINNSSYSVNLNERTILLPGVLYIIIFPIIIIGGIIFISGILISMYLRLR
ncbi:MAG: hypothetical protein RRE78_02640 [Acidianus sp.]|nr:hypothetical protein [Acidianus sp.]